MDILLINTVEYIRMSSQTFIIKYFFDKDNQQQLTDDTVLSFNYVETHFFTSIQFIEMIGDMEQTFSIMFTDEQFKHPHFSTVGGLIRLVDKLVDEKAAHRMQVMGEIN